MFKSLTITNSLGESLNLELENPWKNGIAVKNISGLGTPNYNVNTVPYASGDGSTVGSVIASTRNIIIELYPMMNPQVEDSRQLLYRYFQVKRPVVLTFQLDNRIAVIEGYVESNEPNIFSERESVQISIICPDPYFKEPFISNAFFFGEVPAFEFPFSNESLTEPLLLLTELSLDNRAQIDYDAEIDAGLLIRIDCYSPPGDITIYNVNSLGRIYISDERIEKITGKNLMAGDRITISTLSGDRKVELLRDGVTKNILGSINKDADWFQVSPGPNSYTYSTGKKNASIIMTFNYHRTFASI